MYTFLIPLVFNGLLFTFDDGPSIKYTEKVLDILQKNKIKAVFCLVANRLYDNKRLAIAKRIVREGHIVCNHSVSHPNFAKLSNARQAWQIKKAQNIFKRKLGVTPTLFRPPSGVRTKSMKYILAYYKLKLFMWNIDSKDWWPWTTKQKIYKRVISKWKRRYKRGKNSVVLFHDINPRTVGVLNKIISRTRRNP